MLVVVPVDACIFAQVALPPCAKASITILSTRTRSCKDPGLGLELAEGASATPFIEYAPPAPLSKEIAIPGFACGGGGEGGSGGISTCPVETCPPPQTATQPTVSAGRGYFSAV